MKIMILAGGQSPERPISLVTGKAIKSALADLGHQAELMDPGPDLPQQLWQACERGYEFIWIALHGAGGEDGTVQAMLDWVGLPYQGSGYLASALAMDKAVSKQIFQSKQVTTPAWIECGRQDHLVWSEVVEQLGHPVVIKPVSCGSTFGISIAHTSVECENGIELARGFADRLILEAYIPGKEITVSILDDQVMPPIEILPASGDFYDYEAKYAPGGSRHMIPCSLTEAGRQRAEDLALQAYRVLHCEGLARVDLRIDPNETAWVLEVNTLPGMTPTSLCPDAAAALGWSFNHLVQRILASGCKRRRPLQSAAVAKE